MKARIVMISSLIITSLFLMSCTPEEEGSVTRLYIAHAIDETTPNTGAANEWFREELAAYLGIEVVHVEDINHLIAIEALNAGHLDMVFSSAFNTVMAQEIVDIEIAGTLNHSEVNPIQTLFITAQPDIQTLVDLENRSFAFVSAASNTGFFFPLYHLANELAVDPERMMESNYFFSVAYFSGSHETSINGVNFGDYDAAAVISTVFNSLIATGVIDGSNMHIIDSTPPAPDSSYIMRADLPEEIREGIRSFLLQLDSEDYYRDAWGIENLRFVAPNYETLAQIRSISERVGLSD